MFRKDVKSLTEILGQCLRENGLETPMNQTHVIESWEKVAGPVVARYTEDKYIRNQTLFVKITNPALRADLSMIRSELVKKLNAHVGAQLITDIRFR